jgi:DNA-binding transcriptional MerR regulator
MIGFTSPETEAIIAQLQKQVFTVNDINFSYRAINHYQEKEIIDDFRNDNSKWRRFSGVSITWMYVIELLREFGVSLEKIRKLKNALFKEGKMGFIDKAKFISMPFEQEVAESIHKKYELFLVVFSDMKYSFHDENSIQHIISNNYTKAPFILLPLSSYIRYLWKTVTDRTE